MTTACYQIPTSRLETLKTKVTRLARRCVKLGLPELTLIEHKADQRSKLVHRKDALGFYIPPAQIVYLDCVWCELVGASPKVSDHTFIAKVEHTAAGNIVSRVASNSTEADLDLTSYRTAKPVCDHCQMARKRNDTFVLQASDGTLKQIGRNCLADYLRSDNVETVVAILDLVNEFNASSDQGEGDESEGGFGGGWYAKPLTVDYVACVISAVRAYGWTAKSSGKPRTTSDDALGLVQPCTSSDSEVRADWYKNQPTDADKAKAIVILDWIKSSTDSSDYMHNLRVSCSNHLLTKMSLVASVVPAYLREVEKWEQERAAKLTDPGFYGTLGAKVETQVTISLVRTFEGNYGVTTLLGMKSKEGHSLKWFASGEKNVDVGKQFMIKGTVKSQELRNGIHETNLTRCKLTPISPTTQV